MQDLRKLLSYLSQYKGLVSLSAASHILMALFTVVSVPLIIPFFQVLFTKTPVNVVRPEHWYDIIALLEYHFVTLINQNGTGYALVIVCLLIVLCFFLKNLFRYLAMFFMVPVRSSIVERMRSQLYAKYLDPVFTFDQQNNRGDLITRITADVQEVEWSILRFIDAVFKAPVIIIGSVLFMLSINVKLTLFVFVLMGFTIIVIGTLSKTLKKQSHALQNQLSGMTTIVDETLDGNLLIDIFRSGNFWINRFESLNISFRKILNRVTWRRDLSSPLSEFLGVSVVVVLLWYGSILVLDGELQAEVFFAFIFAFYNVIEPSKSFSTAYYNIQKGAAALERINDLIHSEKTKEIQGETPFAFDKEIRFENVSFAYDAQPVLDDINIVIKKGERVALVGPSGAGKTTLILLLLGHLKPSAGRITIDGTPVPQIQKDAYYRKVGLVTQTAFLFNDTISNNITLGRKNIDSARINEALGLSQSNAFVNALPDQLQTIIGDRGDSLSGGERQRLTIARALLEDPELLILDEPTSSLDPESERGVSRIIMDAMHSRTALIIAHRLSTIKFADRILVLKDGKIIEDGKHEDLLNKNGVYADYVKLQSIN